MTTHEDPKPSVATRALDRLRELVEHVESGKPLSLTFRTTNLRLPRGWTAMNRRRGELIDKKYHGGGITEQEAAELAFLQYVVDEYCSATFPRPMLLDEDELWIIEEALGEQNAKTSEISQPRRPAIGTPPAMQARCLREGHDAAKAGKFPPKCPYTLFRWDTPLHHDFPVDSEVYRWFEGYWLWFGVTRNHVEVMRREKAASRGKSEAPNA